MCKSTLFDSFAPKLIQADHFNKFKIMQQRTIEVTFLR